MKNESAIQQECFIWFTNEFCLKHHEPRFIMFSIPNEGKSLTEQMRKKQMGMLPGASDTVIVLENRVIFCEFKDGKGKQSDKQKDFEERVKSLNHEYWLIRSFEEFKEKIYDL
jgi:hypothetical protein